MSTETPPLAVTSGRRLALALVTSIAVSGILLIVAILPAEYGIDPTGAGSALGLLRGTVAEEPEPPPAADAAMVPQTRGPSAQYAASYRIDRQTFTLGPYEFLEYKYHLVEGGNLVFSWTSTQPLIHDFHSAPDGKGSEAEVSIDKATRSRASGALTAPFAGMHGWFWENPGSTPVTIELTSAGFYVQASERRSNGARRTHELSTAQPTSLLPEVKP